VQWLHFAGEVDKSKTAYCKFLQDFVYQKLFKSVHFNCVIQELIGWHFLKHDVIVKDIVKRSCIGIVTRNFIYRGNAVQICNYKIIVSFT